MTNKLRLLIATTNQGKSIEISNILNNLSELAVELKFLTEYNIVAPEEPHDNFLANAIYKAKYYAKHSNEITFADDSGFCVAALNGAPGVYTKDFIIESGGFAQAYSRIEEMLAGATTYAAYMHNACAIYFPADNFLLTDEAQVHGSMVFPPRGSFGFGFNPIFIPKGSNRTLAELTAEEKIQVTHSSNAILGIVKKLQALYVNMSMA